MHFKCFKYQTLNIHVWQIETELFTFLNCKLSQEKEQLEFFFFKLVEKHEHHEMAFNFLVIVSELFTKCI